MTANPARAYGPARSHARVRDKQGPNHPPSFVPFRANDLDRVNVD